MSGYITTLIGTVIICTLAAMLTPEENGMLGYVKLAAGLCVLCVAIAPLASFIQAVQSFPSGDSFFEDSTGGENNFNQIYEESLLGASEESISEGLRGMICREFKLSSDEIEVFVKLKQTEGGECKTESATVMFVGGKAILTNPHDVIDYVTELLDCRCEIIYA